MERQTDRDCACTYVGHLALADDICLALHNLPPSAIEQSSFTFSVQVSYLAPSALYTPLAVARGVQCTVRMCVNPNPRNVKISPLAVERRRKFSCCIVVSDIGKTPW